MIFVVQDDCVYCAFTLAVSDRSKPFVSSGISHSDSTDALPNLQNASPRQQGLPQQMPGHDMNGNPEIAPDPEDQDWSQPSASPAVATNEPVAQVCFNHWYC